MKKRSIKKKIKKVCKTALIVMLLVSLNINPIAMGATLIIDSGIVNKFGNLGRNLTYLAGKKIDEVYATAPSLTDNTSSPIDVNIVSTPSDYFVDAHYYLMHIMQHTDDIDYNTEGMPEVYNIIKQLYDIGSGYSSNVKIDADHPEYRDYGNSIAVHDEAMTARLLGVNERDLSHVNAAQIEQLMQMGYDPRWINENGTIEEDFDKLIRATHEYSVANVYSLNNMIGGALWRPYSDEIPYIREFAEIVGGFANVYMGYWDTNVSTLKKPINSQRALEILGYDAILRYEGIQVLEPTKILESGVEAIFVPEVVGLNKYTESPVDRTIVTDPDVHEEDIPDRNLGISGRGGVPTGQSGVNENVILRQVMVSENGTKQYVPEEAITEAIVPDSTIIQLYQEEIPNEDITWLDAVTVLYKALGQEQISYQTFTAYNPNLTPETSPLAKDLPGLTSFDGYNFYAFFTRSNPYSGDLSTGSFQAIYWRKAINDGFVSYALRDEPISAEDFYMLAKRMMESYGEPEMSADEMHTLLQIYGSYYPVQLGRAVADSWEYLKCRGILTGDNEPESFTSTLTRDQLLDICMRIKDVDSRITYKNMNLTIDVGEVLRDKDYFPVYDFDLKTEEDDEFAFISTTVNYDAYDYYTYMFPVERAVNLGNSGCGLVYSKPEKSDENLINYALYEGKKHIEGYDYYVIDVPKKYTGQIFLGFQNYDDPGSVNGTVDFIEVPNYCLGGGIYTSYEINESKRIATLVKPELGVSYFPFSSQSNNMDLIYYCDIDRCNTDRPVGSSSPTVASLWDKVIDTWEYLTQPLEVLAAEDFEVVEQDYDNATLVTKISANGDYWTDASEIYGSGENQITITDGSGVKQVSPRAPGWFSALTRASIISKMSMAVWAGSTNDSFELSQMGKDIKADLNSRGGNPNPNISIGSNLVQVVNETWNSNRNSKFIDRVKSRQETNEYTRKGLIAFAAGIKPTQINSIKTGASGDISGFDENVKRAFKYLKDENYGWMQSVGDFNQVSGFSSSVPVYDARGYLQGTTSDYTKATLTMFDEGMFKIYSKGYTPENILDLIGNAGQHGNESGLMTATKEERDKLKTSLATSVLMNKDEQILLRWDDLVATGFAWGLVDGKPSLNKEDNTYTFMTNNGMVKVNDEIHMIQIGSTLYTWPDDDAPNLVFIGDSDDMYLDIRCVTGVINIDVTKVGNKAEVSFSRYGTGTYAVYSISAKNMNTSFYKTKPVSCYNFPDTTKTCGTGNIYPTTMNILHTSIFDGEDMAGGNTYWSESGEDSTMRVLLADANPTANWVLTMTLDDGVPYGRLYVYYLKEAFTTDAYVDGEEPPKPSDEWKKYWEDQIIEQKKRCDANYDSVSYQVKSAMETYNQSVPEGYDWIGLMTEAAMYSVAADTGYFYLSNDYAVRCFDLTENTLDTQPMYTDFSKEVDAIGNDFRSNKPGACYFIDYSGYIYNLPKREDFTLARYLSGEFMLPLVSVDDKEIWNMNMTWYGNTNDGTNIPYGCELTSAGYISYKDFSTVIPSTELPQRSTRTSTYDDRGISTGTDEKLNNTYSEENTDLPFYNPKDGEELDDNENSTFKPAPVAIYSRYGILSYQSNNTKVGSITQSETKRNYYYLGNRVIRISDNYASRDANKIPFDFGSTDYNPIAISSGSEAHFVGQIRRPASRNYYVIPYAKIYSVTSAITSDLQKEHLATDDSYLWDGKAKLVAVLNMIDRSTNFLMWAVFILAPMILIIVMTLLIGLSFITDNKIYLAFCEKFFDPVKVLTLGLKDSSNWFWQDVWRRATITYIAFALFANANILRLVIWAVDGWMKITEALGF